MTAESVAARLRKPFPTEQIGKLPRVTCPKCSDKRNRQGTCDEHPRKERCQVCNAWVSPKHIHIDYVGHGDVTSRLLEADPEWNWEPVATDEHGVPVFDTDDEGLPVGLWIRLTVGGMTRLGYGSVPSGQHDAVKVLIGDALRNAAMRFGVALDLWAKGDRADPTAENATASAGQAQRRRPQQQRGNGQQDGGSWENAKPASRNGQQQPPPDGGEWETEAPDGERAELAQVIADEACQARAVSEMSNLHARADDKGLLGITVRNPATGGEGLLKAYLAWRRNQLSAEARALAELRKAGQAAGLEGEALDARVQELVGAGIEAATVTQMKEAAAKLATAGAAS